MVIKPFYPLKVATGPKTPEADTLRIQVPKKGGLSHLEVTGINFAQCFRVLAPKEKLAQYFETPDFRFALDLSLLIKLR